MDNINVTPGTGSTIAADDVGGVLHQRVKLTLGADGTSDGDVSSSNPLPIDSAELTSIDGKLTSKALSASIVGTDTGIVTHAVIHGLTTGGGGGYVDVKVNPSGALTTEATVISSALPTGAATETTLAAINTKTPALGQTTMAASQPVVIASNQTAVPVSAASLPLPSGAGTSANQATMITALNSIVTNTASAINDTTATGTITALNGAVSVNSQGAYTTAITVSGTWVGTLSFESQNPGGTWIAVPAYLVTSTLPYSPAFTTTANGTFLITGGGYLNTRVRASAFTSGTIQVDLDASLAQQTVFSGQLGSWAVKDLDSSGTAITGLNYSGTKNAWSVAQTSTDFVASTINSSTVQLAASATFAGTVENAFNQQNYSILLVSDQPMTLNIFQYIDGAGAKIAQQSTFTIAANTPFARSGVINGNFIKVSVQNTGASTTTTFQLDTAYGTIAPATVLNNGPIAINEINGTATSYSLGLPVNVLETPKATYSAASLGLVAANTATDIFTIYGSATKTVKVQRIVFTATQTTAAVRDVLLIKRSTANTAGTSTAPTKIPNDSTSAAATATVLAYTANPTTGTAVGTIYCEKVNISTTALGGSKLDLNFTDIWGQPIVLRGTGEGLCVNLNSITSAGNLINITVFWTEE